jgi:hypothetical protein
MRKLLLIPTLFFFACSPLRHYKKVALDPFRSTQERELLAKAANEEFPEYVSDSTPLVTVEIDSSEVTRLNEAYNALLDDYLGHLEEDTIPVTQSLMMTEERLKIPPYANRCSHVNHVAQFSDSRLNGLINGMKQLIQKPAVVTRTVTKEIKVIDGIWKAKKESEVSHCREELRLMTFQKDELKIKVKNKNTIIYTLGGFLFILAALVAWKPRIPFL